MKIHIDDQRRRLRRKEDWCDEEELKKNNYPCDVRDCLSKRRSQKKKPTSLFSL